MTQANDVGRRTRVSRPYPTFTLEDALDVARAIHEINAGLPFERELLAGAIGTTPKSSAFTMKLNASAAYGLTEGGYNDPDISLTRLGEAAVSSESDAGRNRALAAAAMRPDTFSRFYLLFNRRRLPQDTYLRSILQRELGVRPDLIEECLGIIRDNGEFAGIISEEDGTYDVELPEAFETVGDGTVQSAKSREQSGPQTARENANISASTELADERSKGIFVGHIGDSEAARYVATVLQQFGVSSATTLIPDEDGGLLVAREVATAMRESSSAILIFRSGDDSWSSRDRMIGLIGAASVLFDDRFIVMHEDGEQMSIELDGLVHIDFDRQRPGDSGIQLLTALHRAGIMKISV